MSVKKKKKPEPVDIGDWLLFQHVNKDRFAVLGLMPILQTDYLEAFERGIDKKYYALIDVNQGGRVFKLSAIGLRRYAELVKLFPKEKKV